MKRAALFCAIAACVFLADLASSRGLQAGRWTHPLRTSAQTAGPEARSSTAPRDATHRTDTTRQRVAAGDVLVTTLPAQVGGRPVAAYELIRPPALSDLAGRSFFWRTRSQDAGRHRFLFRARFDTVSSSNAPADTLALVVTVE